MVTYPLIERLGLKVFDHMCVTGEIKYVVKAFDIEQLLASAPVVYASDYLYLWTNQQTKTDTKEALLLGIQPIKQETAEDLLREFVACCEVSDPKLRWGELRERAKRCLGEK